jgi:putative serine protease PepD
VSTAEPARLFCHRCGAENHPAARFCHHCGRDLADHDAARPKPTPAPPQRRLARIVRFVPAVAAVAALALAGAAYVATRDDNPAASPARLEALDASVRATRAQAAAAGEQVRELGKRVDSLAAALAREQQGLAPIATRVLRSVVTVDTRDSSGTAFSAWRRGGTTYLITAAHVVADSLAEDETGVALTRKDETWPGRVVRADYGNDLALIRTRGDVGAPLWADPTPRRVPSPGDELLLVGSPYGLEGTVTTGIVSRVTYNEIQTDAAANPGNSGGPAIDGDGNVVGVLLAGEGQGINFAVPIERACVTLRSC